MSSPTVFAFLPCRPPTRFCNCANLSGFSIAILLFITVSNLASSSPNKFMKLIAACGVKSPAPTIVSSCTSNSLLSNPADSSRNFLTNGSPSNFVTTCCFAPSKNAVSPLATFCDALNRAS